MKSKHTVHIDVDAIDWDAPPADLVDLVDDENLEFKATTLEAVEQGDYGDNVQIIPEKKVTFEDRLRANMPKETSKQDLPESLSNVVSIKLR